MLGGNGIEAGYQPALVQSKAHKFVVLSGCSGAGKSSLLSELGRRGFPIYEEPGRQVVKEQLYIGGDALPWGNVSQFLELTISRSIHHMVTAARRNQLSFFDRGIIDQVSGLAQLGSLIPEHLAAAVRRFRYHDTVFVMPRGRKSSPRTTNESIASRMRSRATRCSSAPTSDLAIRLFSFQSST
jgi:predicted ATPase